MIFYRFGCWPKPGISSATVSKVYTEFKWSEIANRRAGLHWEFFSPIVFLCPVFKSLPLPKPSFLSVFPRFVILPGGAGVKGWGCGKTFDSVSLSWRNPLTDLYILAHNDKWVSNFPPDLGATKHTFPLSPAASERVQSNYISWVLQAGLARP